MIKPLFFPIQTLVIIVLSVFQSYAQPQMKALGPVKSANVNCSLEDHTGNIWFGVSGEGIYRYNPANEKEGFVNFRTEDGLSSNNVISILEDNAGNIWLGTDSGLCKYHSSSGGPAEMKNTFTPVPIVISNSTYFQESAETTEIKRNIWSMIQDKTGRIWLGTDEGVFHFNPGGKTDKERMFTYFLQYDYIDNPDNLKLTATTSVMEDNKGNIWFTTWFEGLCCYDGKSITRYTPDGKIWFATVFEDKSGNLWVGSRDKGVYRYTPSAEPIRSESFVNYFPTTEIFNSCAVPIITEDHAGNIWFGTEFSDLSKRADLGGLWRYHPADASSNQKETFTNFTVKDGLPNNSVFDLLADQSGKLWIGTRNMGLCSYDTRLDVKQKPVFVHYTE